MHPELRVCIILKKFKVKKAYWIFSFHCFLSIFIFITCAPLCFTVSHEKKRKCLPKRMLVAKHSDKTKNLNFNDCLIELFFSVWVCNKAKKYNDQTNAELCKIQK